MSLTIEKMLRLTDTRGSRSCPAALQASATTASSARTRETRSSSRRRQRQQGRKPSAPLRSSSPPSSRASVTVRVLERCRDAHGDVVGLLVVPAQIRPVVTDPCWCPSPLRDAEQSWRRAARSGSASARRSRAGAGSPPAPARSRRPWPTTFAVSRALVARPSSGHANRATRPRSSNRRTRCDSRGSVALVRIDQRGHPQRLVSRLRASRAPSARSGEGRHPGAAGFRGTGQFDHRGQVHPSLQLVLGR